MDAALRPLPPATATPFAALAAIPPRRKWMAAGGIAALIAILAVSVLWTREPDWGVLFANTTDKDGGAIIASLSQMNVPYRFAPGGAAILVPENRVHDARLKLASQGLPRGGTVGFELLENQKFGVTQFQERLNFQRGLEGELARSIQSIAAVQGARVHLALPTQNGFLREQQKASASVLLSMHPGLQIDRAQVAGIVHLVASSVPNLSPKQVSVVDQTGALLSSDSDAAANGLDATQLNYVRNIETTLNRRVLDIVEPIVGAGNVRAQVAADVDFTQSESTAEQYRPNQGNEPAAVRSQQKIEAPTGDAAQAQGVPGALSNQPPQASTAAVNGPAQTVRAAGAANGAEAPAGATSTRRESVTNYEVDKTVRVTRNASGTIKRLSAAVVVDHRRSIDENGKVVRTPLTADELNNVHSLVREAIGFNPERGDSINVVNAPFTEIEAPKEIEVPLWRDPANLALARDLGKQLGLVALALIVVFALIRPALKAAPRTPRAPALAAQVDDPLQLPEPAAAPRQLPSSGQRHDDILKTARDNPGTVANVVRSWVAAEPKGT